MSAWGLITYVCAAARRCVTAAAPWEPSGLICRALQKTAYELQIKVIFLLSSYSVRFLLGVSADMIILPLKITLKIWYPETHTEK